MLEEAVDAEGAGATAGAEEAAVTDGAWGVIPLASGVGGLSSLRFVDEDEAFTGNCKKKY